MVLIQTNLIFEIDSHQSTHEIIYASLRVDSSEDGNFHKQVQHALPNPIIIPQKEVIKKKHKTGSS